MTGEPFNWIVQVSPRQGIRTPTTALPMRVPLPIGLAGEPESLMPGWGEVLSPLSQSHLPPSRLFGRPAGLLRLHVIPLPAVSDLPRAHRRAPNGTTMSKWPNTEAQLAGVVSAWLSANGWTVYAEVQPWSSGPVADIVAVRGGVSWIIETKRTATLEVLAQAERWLGYATLVSVAVPRAVKGRGAIFERVAAMLGVGVVLVWEIGDPSFRHGKMFRKTHNGVLNKLCIEQAQSIPGSRSGGQFTPFKGTANALARLVAVKPGITMKEAVAEIDHHYSSHASARGALVHAIRAGLIDGVRADVVGRKLLLFPAEAS